MEIEIQGIPQSVRSGYHTRLRSAKGDLTKFKKLLADSRSQLARADLLASNNGVNAYASSDDPYGASSDRTRLLQGTSILEQGTKRLQQSQQMALETENQGADILLNLRTQREQIENSRNTVCQYTLFSIFLLNRIYHSYNERTWQLTAPLERSRKWSDGEYTPKPHRSPLSPPTSSMTDLSDTTISIPYRMYQQRAVTIGIIAVLILLIIVIAWEKLSK